MAMTVIEIKDWLSSLNDDDQVGIDEGGLCLRVVELPGVYLEMGGIPEGEDEEPEGLKTYSVLVTRDITESAVVKVQARSKREAWDKVFQEAVNQEVAGWQTNDGSEGEPYLGDPENDIREVKGGVTCALCGKETDAETAHLHQGGYVGECCWDDRLKASE